MKRPFAVALAGMALIVACSGDNFYDPPPYPPTFTGGSSGAVFGTTSGTTSSNGGSGTGSSPAYCTDRPYCGGGGCCPPSWRCVRDECMPPGIECSSDADCSSERYCDLDLVEPRCFPREEYCDAPDAGSECITIMCETGPDISISRGAATCDEISIYVLNRGRKTLPRGALVAFEMKLRGVDAAADGGDAGDAGPPVVTVVGSTKDGILPGETALLVTPVDVDYRASIAAMVVRDAGAAAGDCEPYDDRDAIPNSCGIPK